MGEKCSTEKPSADRPTSESDVTPAKLNGIVNKGNTCYANSIIQCLFALPSFCFHLFSLISPKTSLSKSFLKICQALKSAKVPVDPSPFLSALKGVAIKSGKEAFDISSQHDVAEILELVLSEFTIDSPFVGGLFDISVIFSRQCKTCDESSSSEVLTPFLKSLSVTTLMALLQLFFFLLLWRKCAIFVENQ